jgi:hypothetical protein
MATSFIFNPFTGTLDSVVREGDVPAGTDRQVQYNDNGDLAGSNMQYVKETGAMVFGHGNVYLRRGQKLYFDA